MDGEVPKCTNEAGAELEQCFTVELGFPLDMSDERIAEIMQLVRDTAAQYGCTIEVINDE